MPVNTPNAEYKKRADQWRKCRDCIEGEDAVKAEGVRYLPKIAGQDADRYAAYVKRALFFNATGRTVQALLGFLFRKPPVLSPDNETAFFNGVTLHDSYDSLLKSVATEVISVGRVGVLCDADPNDGFVIKLVTYRTEDVLSWTGEQSYSANP